MSRQIARWDLRPERAAGVVPVLVRSMRQQGDRVVGMLLGEVSSRSETLRVVHSQSGTVVMTAVARLAADRRRVLVSLGESQVFGAERESAVSSLLDRCESLALSLNVQRLEVDVPIGDAGLRALHEGFGYRPGLMLMAADGQVYCRHWRPLGTHTTVTRKSAPRRTSLLGWFQS